MKKSTEATKNGDNFMEKAENFVVFGFKSNTNLELDNYIENSDFSNLSKFVIYKSYISKSHVDSPNKLHFNLFLPYEEDLNSYIYGIGLTDNSGNIISATSVPKSLKSSGTGGKYVYQISMDNKGSSEVSVECPITEIKMKGGDHCRAIMNCEYCSYCLPD